MRVCKDINSKPLTGNKTKVFKDCLIRNQCTQNKTGKLKEVNFRYKNKHYETQKLIKE